MRHRGRLVTGLATTALTAGLLAGTAVASADAAPSRNSAGTAERECNYYHGRPPVIRPGTSGPAVLQIQCLINTRSNYPDPVPETGDFDPPTIKAVGYVQRCNGIAVDGVIGPRTWRALEHPIPACAK